MTWRLATCSNRFRRFVEVAALLAALSAPLLASTVMGATRLVQSTDSAVKKKGDFSGVVVWLTSLGDPKSLAAHKVSVMLQKNKKFSPHILAIQTGTIVDFPNLDPIFHNAFSNYDGQSFDVALYPPGSSRRVRFDRPGIVRVFCNIHPAMSAIIVVVDSASFTTTDSKGSFVLNNVAPGRYRIHFFHERATPDNLAKLTHEIIVGPGLQSLDLTTISEAGYLPTTHKNKYGQEYPPSPDTYDGSPLQNK